MTVIPEFTYNLGKAEVVCPELKVQYPKEMLMVLGSPEWEQDLEYSGYICIALRRNWYRSPKCVENALFERYGAASLNTVALMAHFNLSNLGGVRNLTIGQREAVNHQDVMRLRHAWCDHIRNYLQNLVGELNEAMG